MVVVLNCTLVNLCTLDSPMNLQLQVFMHQAHFCIQYYLWIETDCKYAKQSKVVIRYKYCSAFETRAQAIIRRGIVPCRTL